jgi:hypothetical protein
MGNTLDDGNEDWAVLKIDKSAITDIDTPRLYQGAVNMDTPLYPAGFPAVKMLDPKDGFGFNAIRAERILPAELSGNLIKRPLGQSSTGGMSGGPVFAQYPIDNKGNAEMQVAAISVSRGQILSVKNILFQLKQKSPDLLKKIFAGPDKDGNCP